MDKYTEVLKKLMKFCAYQERSHHEARKKIYNLGMFGDDAENILAELIENNYLNEERFAISFAGGKFRMKNWGREKIAFELERREVSDYCIRKALAEIDEDDYLRTLNLIIDQKMQQYADLGTLLAKDKTLNYCTGRGFEIDLVLRLLRRIN